jgi:hypothetical protein
MLVVAAGAALAWAAATGAVTAADISTDRGATCDIRLSGEIDSGDADTLLAAIKAVDKKNVPAPRLRLEYEMEMASFIPRLCLDSPGGRFDEAMQFIRATLKQVSFATVVEQGAKCYSACALIFLAGHLNHGDGYFELYRRLHIDGQLGFHAPYIPAVGAATNDKLLNASYRAGVTAVGELLNLEGKFFQRSLLSEFLKVGPDEYFRMERIGHLAAGDIVLTGYARPTSVHAEEIAHVCNNQRLRDNADYYYNAMIVEGRVASGPEKGDRIPVGDTVVRRTEPSIEGVAGCSVLMRMHAGTLFLRADTTSTTAGDDDERPWPRASFLSAKAQANIRGMDADGLTPAFYLFPVNAKIADLPRAD